MTSFAPRRSAILGFFAPVFFAATSHAQVTPIVFDFDSLGQVAGDPWGGTVGGGYSYTGGGTEASGWCCLNPTVVEGVTAAGAGGTQGYEVNWDAAIAAGGYAYFGLGGTFRYHNSGDLGWADGQVGQNNLAGYALSFDLKSAGATNAQPLRGNMTLYKGDWEAVNSIDANNDGDMDDGFDIWTAEFKVPVVADNYANFNHVELSLADFAAPTAPANTPAAVGAPLFNDAATFGFQMYFSEGEYGTDAGNIISVDNIALTFTSIAPIDGDYDNDNDVDGDDFLIWQRGGSPNGATAGDLALWQANFGTGGMSSGAAAGVPEPLSASLLLTAFAGFWAARRRRR